MKTLKSFLKIFILMIAVSSSTSCGSNDAELNEAKGMENWSPAGKIYISVASEEYAKSEGFDYLVAVIHFIDDKQVESYTTPNKDLTYNREYPFRYNGTYNYIGEYPRYEFKGIKSGETIHVLKFSDPNTCKFTSHKEIYTLVSD